MHPGGRPERPWIMIPQRPRRDHGFGRHGGDGPGKLHDGRSPVLRQFYLGRICGKCAPCREGLSQMLRILTDITEGRARREDPTISNVLLSRYETRRLRSGPNRGESGTHHTQVFRDEYLCILTKNAVRPGFVKASSRRCAKLLPAHMNIPGYLALLRRDGSRTRLN